MSDGRGRAGERLVSVDELEGTVEKLVAGGDGLIRFEGIPIFVPRSAPGDRLRVRITERRPDYGRAEIVEIVEPGPGRREPPCPYFVRCGGCDLQHLEDDLQVELKVAAARETLQRIGGVEWPAEVEVIAGAPWAYRLRTQLHTESDAGETRVGYFERGSHELVAVESCPILVPELEELLPGLPASLGPEPPRRLDLAAGAGGAVTAAPVTGDLPHGPVQLTVGEHTYGFDARVFFQAHRELLPRLVEVAVGEWSGERAIDLYAGVGLFALPLARRYRSVTAVEVDAAAGRLARNNARRNRVENLELVTSAVESWIERLPEESERLLVDPPRAGLPSTIRRALLRRPPRRLTYVSCHVATLARDLRALERVLRLESLTLLDLFPQSGHLEIVAQLVGR